MATGTSSPDKLSIVVYAGFYDKVHYALVMASSAAAIDRPVTLFFTMGACRVLKKTGTGGEPAWRSMPLSKGEGRGCANGGEKDDAYAATNVATFEELLRSCVQMGVTFMVCEMGLRAGALEDLPLRDDVAIEERGVVTFLNDASKDGAVIFL